ncbi:Os10g0328600 [Oryza sativa Japonica Group]|uniref:Os10g0328600 protein n=2 Tax=Oryza sativa subsp. japonica TaxID=39947 RepID=Q0IYE3_ORYSJ|nr:Os10g0328600 [Oryza sativa Japonica Group]BAT10349.1 Os10g0328600 [Oryza sativa Japonica Group]|eukprot:NP_001064358.1 Os10g0328600 [Oryza sativa Japonica Group]
MPLLRRRRRRWNVGDGAPVEVPDPVRVAGVGALLQPDEVEPRVVAQRVRGHRALVLGPPLGDDAVLDAMAVAEPLLEREELLAQLLGAGLGRLATERVLVYCTRSVRLPAPLLEVGERGEQHGGVVVVAGGGEQAPGVLVHAGRAVQVLQFRLELGEKDERVGARESSNMPLVHGSGTVQLAVAELERGVRGPGIGAGAPRRPPIEHYAGVVCGAEEILHAEVLRPDAVSAREDRHGAVKYVARVPDAAATSLELRILYPHTMVAVRRRAAGQRALVHGSRAGGVAAAAAGGLLPPRVPHPLRRRVAASSATAAGSADDGLEPCASLEPVLGELVGIDDPPLLGLRRQADGHRSIAVQFAGLTDEMLGRELHGRRCFVLDAAGGRQHRQ